MDDVNLLLKLWQGNYGLGGVIIWNAIYHLQLRHGVENHVIPTFHKQWHSGQWWIT